ncbi:hypothetical protein CDAR_618411 [Caerostris darwini]|uniref:Uncharacterized protein n=1 Tax=Caerostris darwini TaxID=1538125 RepID=A0AAV4SR63_9ARAC|nr:hypothetical protein CDAR_618411 [Caerostris darwini]
MPRNRIAEQIAFRTDRGTKQYSLRILGERKAAVIEENAERKSIKKIGEDCNLLSYSIVLVYRIFPYRVCASAEHSLSAIARIVRGKKRRFGAICLTNDQIKGEFLCFCSDGQLFRGLRSSFDGMEIVRKRTKEKNDFLEVKRMIEIDISVNHQNVAVWIAMGLNSRNKHQIVQNVQQNGQIGSVK